VSAWDPRRDRTAPAPALSRDVRLSLLSGMGPVSRLSGVPIVQEQPRPLPRVWPVTHGNANTVLLSSRHTTHVTHVAATSSSATTSSWNGLSIGLVSCYWSSSAQSILVSGPVETHEYNLRPFMRFQFRPDLRLLKGSDWCP
jgi:hypothetical protein